jgi:hypothetical protein
MTKPTFLTCPPAVTTTQGPKKVGYPGYGQSGVPLPLITSPPPIWSAAAKRRQFRSRPSEIAGVMAHRMLHLTHPGARKPVVLRHLAGPAFERLAVEFTCDFVHKVLFAWYYLRAARCRFGQRGSEALASGIRTASRFCASACERRLRIGQRAASRSSRPERNRR